MDQTSITEIKIELENAFCCILSLDINHDRSSYGLYSWKECIEYLQVINFTVDNNPITINIDWEDSLERISKQQKSVAELHKSMREWAVNKSSSQTDFLFHELLNEIYDDSYNIKFCCKVNTTKESAVEYVKRFIYLLYLALNFSSPGCIAIQNTKIEVEGSFGVEVYPIADEQLFQEQIKEINNLKLFSEPFQYIGDVTGKFGWPEIKELSFRNVWDWLLGLDLWNTLNANTNIQKAMFAFIYSIITNAFQKQFELEMIYLAFGLEALFDTPEQGISNALRERIFLVLGVPQQNTKEIQKAINHFYGVRSKFAHGDMDLINPIFSFSQNTMDYYADKIWGHCQFAQTIMISTFQKMIENKWHSLKFLSSFCGE